MTSIALSTLDPPFPASLPSSIPAAPSSWRRISASTSPSPSPSRSLPSSFSLSSTLPPLKLTPLLPPPFVSPHHASRRLPFSLSSVVLVPNVPSAFKRFSGLAPSDQAFFLLGSIAVMTCGAILALLATAIPTLNAMRRAANSLEKLADVALEELPATMAAIRLSGMEISDLTLELSDLSQEISEISQSVRSSARAVHAAEMGIRRMGAFAASQTLSMLQEHASVPVEAVKPVVATAAETTWQAVTQAQKVVLGLTALPRLSKWLQKKTMEEQEKIKEDMKESGSSGTYEEESSNIEEYEGPETNELML